MSHFAKINENNLVIFVTVGRDEDNEVDISNRTGQTYKQTSYNTRGGVHYGPDGQPSGKPAFRGNYAGIGYTYDEANDVFIAPRPTDRNNLTCDSWTVSAPTWLWTPPTPYPTDVGTQEAPKFYAWDEPTKTWELVTT